MGRGGGSSGARGGGGGASGWANGLTSDEKGAIGAYTDAGYVEINGHLRGQLGAAGPGVLGSISHLDVALSRARLGKDTIVYRGISSLQALGLSERTLVGATITDKGFMSTSTSRSSAGGFGGRSGGVLLRIKARKGSRGAHVGSVSTHKHEKEVLFARGSKVRITRARRTRSGVLVARGVLE